jgi:hypothetical protein
MNDPDAVLSTLAALATTSPLVDHGADSVDGTDRAPDRYLREDGRETIDVIREDLGDPDFVAWCRGNCLKYQDRARRRGTGTRAAEKANEDLRKAAFYAAMIVHVDGYGPDPRSYRRAA